MHFLIWVYTSQDFAQTQQDFVQSHDCTTTTFRSSGESRVAMDVGKLHTRDFIQETLNYYN